MKNFSLKRCYILCSAILLFFLLSWIPTSVSAQIGGPSLGNGDTCRWDDYNRCCDVSTEGSECGSVSPPWC